MSLSRRDPDLPGAFGTKRTLGRCVGSGKSLTKFQVMPDSRTLGNHQSYALKLQNQGPLRDCSHETPRLPPTGNPSDILAGACCDGRPCPGNGPAQASATRSGKNRTHGERLDPRLSKGRRDSSGSAKCSVDSDG